MPVSDEEIKLFAAFILALLSFLNVQYISRKKIQISKINKNIDGIDISKGTKDPIKIESLQNPQIKTQQKSKTIQQTPAIRQLIFANYKLSPPQNQNIQYNKQTSLISDSTNSQKNSATIDPTLKSQPTPKNIQPFPNKQEIKTNTNLSNNKIADQLILKDENLNKPTQIKKADVIEIVNRASRDFQMRHFGIKKQSNSWGQKTQRKNPCAHHKKIIKKNQRKRRNRSSSSGSEKIGKSEYEQQIEEKQKCQKNESYSNIKIQNIFGERMEEQTPVSRQNFPRSRISKRKRSQSQSQQKSRNSRQKSRSRSRQKKRVKKRQQKPNKNSQNFKLSKNNYLQNQTDNNKRACKKCQQYIQTISILLKEMKCCKCCQHSNH